MSAASLAFAFALYPLPSTLCLFAFLPFCLFTFLPFYLFTFLPLLTFIKIFPPSLRLLLNRIYFHLFFSKLKTRIPMNYMDWHRHFQNNIHHFDHIDWTSSDHLTSAEKETILTSIQQFQKGENSEGKNLIRFARESKVSSNRF